MSCKHCFTAHASGSFIQKEKVFQLLDQLLELGIYRIYYTYGEPILAENFFEIVSYAKKNNFFQILLTNGFYLYDDNLVKKIKKSGIDYVSVSIDSSNKNKHDSNRNKKNSFDYAMKALENLHNNSMSFGIGTTVTNDNVNEINEIYKIAIEKKCNSISFLTERKNCKLCTIFGLEDAVYKLISNQKNKKKPIILFHDVNLISVFKKLYEEKIIDLNEYIFYKEMCMCHSLKNSLSIDPDGNVFGCNYSSKSIGNIYKNSLASILNDSVDADSDNCIRE